MGTCYFPLRTPFTSLRPEVLGGHTHVGVWVNHAKAGTLVFRNEEWAEAMPVFFDDMPVMNAYYGGKAEGTVVNEHKKGLVDQDQVTDERGVLLTVEQVRALAGQGKEV